MTFTHLRARAIQRLAGHLMTRPIPYDVVQWVADNAAEHDAFTHRGPVDAAKDIFGVVAESLRNAFAQTAHTMPSQGADR